MNYKLMPLALLLLLGCKEPLEVEEKEYVETEYDYKIVDNRQIAWKDILSKSKDRYVVYFYSEYCGYCKQIKQDILSYYLKDMDEMYFVNTVKEKAVFKSNDGLLTGTKKIEDFYIFGTPFLVEVTDYTITNWYAGVDSIKLYISTRTDNKK